MANDKKFVVKRGLATPNVDFANGSGSISATFLSTSNTLSFSGNTGQLFSITDSMSGTIFSVNDISGIPSIEVIDTGAVKLAETFGSVAIGANTVSNFKFNVSGNTLFGNSVTFNSTIIANGAVGTSGFVLTSNGTGVYWAAANSSIASVATANNATFAYGKQEAQLSVANAVFADTANNALRFNGKQEAQLSVAAANTALFLQNRTWETAGAIGATVANTGAFTTITASANVNIDSGVLVVDSTTNRVGIGTIPTTDRTLYVLGPVGGVANSSNSSGEIAFFQSTTTQGIAIGASASAPFGAWLQAKRGTNDGTTWPLLLNPVDGNVSIGSSTAPTKLFVNGHMSIANGFGLFANGTLGANGLVLTSNGSSLYWGSVSASGGGFTGNTVSANSTIIRNQSYAVNAAAGWVTMTLPSTVTTGDIFIVHTYGGNTRILNNSINIMDIGTGNDLVLENGETVWLQAVNATAVDVLFTYPAGGAPAIVANSTFATTANNALFVYGKQESQLSVATSANAVFATTANNALRFNGKQEAQLSVANAVFADTSNNALRFNGKQEAQLSVANAVFASTANNSLFSNSASFVYGKQEAQLSVANAVFATTAGSVLGGNVSGTVATANNALFLNGANSQFYTNATNITTGTLAEARLPFRMNQNVRTTDDVIFANGTFTGTVSIGGNLVLTGNLISQNIQSLSVIDPLIKLGVNNASDAIWGGFTFHYSGSGNTTNHAGLVRSPTTKEFILMSTFGDETAVANNNTININDSSFTYANLQVNFLRIGNNTNTSTLSVTNYTGTANNATFAYGKQESQLIAGTATTANNASFLNGRIWETAGAIGSTVANTGAFTSLTASANVNLDSGTFFVDGLSNRAGVGTLVPSVKFDVVGSDGDGLQYRTSTRTIGIGSVGGLNALYGGSGTELIFHIGSEHMRLTSAGRLGIGTQTPQTPFVVSNAGAGGLEFDGSTGLIQSYNRSTSAYQTMLFDAATMVFRPSGTEAARITATGNVAIGSTAAPTRLFVNGHMSVANGFGLFANGTLGANGLVLTSNGTSLFWGSVSSGTATTANNANFLQERTWATPFAIGSTVANTGAFTALTASANVNIDSGLLFTDAINNRVGISNTNPTASLHVQGTTLIGGDGVNSYDFRLQRLNSGVRAVQHDFSASANSPWILHGENLLWTGERAGTVESTQAFRPYYEAFAPVVGYKEFGFANVTSGNFTGSNLIPNLVLTSGGNVGIRTTTPTTSLHVVGNQIRLVNAADTQNILLQADVARAAIQAPNGTLSFDTVTTERMRIDSAGNIGIGATPSGTFRLNVNSASSDNLRLYSLGSTTTLTLANDINVNQIRSTDGRLGLFHNIVGTMTEGLSLTAGGNVAIGSTAAPTRLFVNGHMSVANGFGIFANGTLGANGLVLTSNGTSLFWGSVSAASALTANNASFLNGRIWETAGAIGSTVANTGVFTTLTARPNQTGAIPAVQASNNTIGMYMVPNAGSGAYNNLVSAGDNLIYFSNNTINGGNLVIGAWSDRASGYGIRFSNAFSIAVVSNTFVMTANTTINGNTLLNGNVNIDSSTLFVDATTNRVGIGISSPILTELQVVGHTHSSTGVSIGTDAGRFTPTGFGTTTPNSGMGSNASSVMALSGFNGITFYTNATTQRLRIDAGGNVSIGTTDSTPTRLFVNGHMSVANGFGIFANGTLGANGLVLTSNGTSLFWGSVSAGGGTTTNAVTFNNGGSGAASGTTFDGSAARTISYNTVGAPSTTGTNASGNWGINVTGSSASAGLVTGTSGQLQAHDIRTIAPSAITAPRAQFGFTSFNNNNTSPYADFFHLRSYSDSSGGNDNLVMFRKDAIGMRIYQQTYGSATNYASFKDIAFTDGTNASGSWGISVTGSSASTTGNAATATALQTARTIGGVSFNGTANIDLPGVNTAGNQNTSGTAASTPNPTFSADAVTKNDLTTRTETGFYESSTGTLAEGWPTDSNGWHHLISATHSNDGNYFALQLSSRFDTQNLYFRNTNGSGTTAWSTLLHSGNFNSYSPTLTGTGASGTWGINITGTAPLVSRTVAADSFAPLVEATIGTNDFFRIGVGGGSNAGFVEIATADDGTEPIFVRQYTGVFTTIARTATILDTAGNTQFPGTLSAAGSFSLTGSRPLAYGASGGTLSIQGDSGGWATGLYFLGSGGTNLGGWGGLGGGNALTYLWAGTSFSSPAIEVYTTGQYAQSPGSFRAPIFYDSNNTGRYLDPNGTSQLVGTTIITLNGNSNDAFGGLEMRENNLQGVGTGAASEAPGINFHWAARAAARFYMAADGNFVLGGQSDITNNRRSLSINELIATIFRDSNNTAFVIDPAGTSNINTLNGNGKQIFNTGDSYLRINEGAAFSNGCWFGGSLLQGGGFYTGSNGGTTNSRVAIIGGTFDGVNAITLDGSAGTISTRGGIHISTANGTGNGLILADDGDIVDLNDGFCAMRFSNGVRVHSGNRTGGAVVSLTSGGAVIASGNITAFGSPSDIKLKYNIENIPNALEKLLTLNGVNFNYKKDGARSTGVIAQEVEKVLPEVIYEATNPEGTEHFKAVRYGNMVGLLIEAIKEQQTMINSLQEQINLLKEDK